MSAPWTVDRVAPGEVIASDGTRIAYQRVGDGPPVVVLPGAMNPGAAWLGVARELAGDHTTYLVDRRGYPPSGPGPRPSSFEAETAHVRAVAEVAGAPVHLLGHSYGGVLALHCALADPDAVRTLVLYEAPVLAGGPHVADVLRRYRELLAAGDPAGAIGAFLRDVVHLPAEAVAAMAGAREGAPDPVALTALAGSLLPDVESIAGLGTGVDRWAAVRQPVLLMGGALSWTDVQQSTAALRRVLPGAESVTWPGQSHFASMLAPALVAATVREFLARHP